MKYIHFFNIALFSTAIAFLLTGCETESSDQIAISISPSSVTLAKGESQEFVASGWRDYTWHISQPSIGMLSTKKGDRTTYTAISGPVSTNDTFTQVLSLTINVPDDSSYASNAVPNASSSVSAEAIIFHH